MHKLLSKILLLDLMTDRTQRRPATFDKGRDKRSMRTVTGDADSTTDRAVNMLGLTLILMAFIGTVGPGRNNSFEVEFSLS